MAVLTLARAKAVALPFFILFAIILVLDTLTGFRFGFLGHFRIVYATSTSRWKRVWTGFGNWYNKFAFLFPVYVVLIVLCPPVFSMFLIYDAICMIIFVFWPDRVTLKAHTPWYAHFHSRKHDAYQRSEIAGVAPPDIDETYDERTDTNLDRRWAGTKPTDAPGEMPGAPAYPDVSPYSEAPNTPKATPAVPQGTSGFTQVELGTHKEGGRGRPSWASNPPVGDAARTAAPQSPSTE